MSAGRVQALARPRPPRGGLGEFNAWRQRMAWALAGAAGILGWLMLRSDLAAGAGSACVLREMFHVGCATCGFTRALGALAAGDVVASLALHPMALVVAVEVVLMWALWGVAAWGGRPVLHARWVWRIAAATVAMAVIVWIVRLVTGTIPV